MGCSQSNIKSSVVPSTDVRIQPTITIRPTSSNQQPTRVLDNCLIIWLLREPSTDIDNQKTKLRRFVSTLKTFTDPNECAAYITTIRLEKVFLIVPSIDLLLRSTQCSPQIEKVYILNSSISQNEKHHNELLSLNTFDDIDLLCKQLETDVELCELDLIDIMGITVSTESGISLNESKKQEASFLYLQVMREMLSRLKYENNAKDEFVNFCRTHYADDDEQLRLIKDFDTNYRPSKALPWLTCKCFIWRVMQRIQRTQEIDIHYKMGFLAKHIHIQLNIFQENTLSMKENRWIVYRGKTMLMDRFNVLVKNNCGGLLSFAMFFIGHTDKRVAIDFVTRRLETHSDFAGIIFEIHLDSKKRSARSPYATLDEVYSDETIEKNGIFFSLYSVFRIESIEETTAGIIPMCVVKLILVVDDDPQLLRIVAPLRSSEVQANPLSYIGKLFMDKGDYDQAEQFFVKMLHDTNIVNQPRRLARVYKGLGAIYLIKNEYTKALEHYHEALKINLSYSSSKHIDLVPLYDGIGSSYYKQGDYLNALQNYEKAVNLLVHNKQPANDSFLNDLNLRINNIKTVLNNKQSV